MATIPFPDTKVSRAWSRRRWLALAFLAASLALAAACAAAASPRGWAPPVVSQDQLFVSLEAGRLSAYAREGDGWRFLWRFPPQGNNNVRPQAFYGAPIVTDNAIYAGGYDGTVYAVDRAQGTLLWRFDTGGPIIAPLAFDAASGTVYAASDDGRVYALDAGNGSLRPGWPFRTGEGIWARPLLDGRTLYVASLDGRLYALDATSGSRLWDVEVGAGLISDPVLAGGTIVVGAADRRLYAVDVAQRALKWPAPPRAENWFWAEPLVVGDTVYAPNLDGTVYAVALNDGSVRWTFVAENPVRARPLLAGDVLVVVDREGVVYGLDAATGNEVWDSRPALLDRALADPIPFGDRVLLTTQNGGLFLLDPGSGQVQRITLPRP